jgi:hypothetical protein
MEQPFDSSGDSASFVGGFLIWDVVGEALSIDNSTSAKLLFPPFSVVALNSNFNFLPLPSYVYRQRKINTTLSFEEKNLQPLPFLPSN